ncbi:hypothetical protein OZ664_16900 [Elizabethkingia sp. HX WHF]|uniref:hypothetical protein n=1 Tax=Elizabethkingia TaxID=308865 RepID=UPI00099A9DDD|nr:MULTISPECIES: hypothetical protein [Elizabethkingia]ATL44003.1 hypothetical protein CQS02_12190 [Elizabethkingia miricola]MCL1639562.1 hypothetical protein [Elizabethkingia bruuniana]MDX8565688.1 hypothetical protein [Elizabethkingia sp. HX WHF]OPC27196.1 hypothetical protein BAY00_16755 [Elizabethkingia bruuniana]
MKKILTAIFISLFFISCFAQNGISSKDFELKEIYIADSISKREISYNSKTMIFEETNVYYKSGQNSQRPSVKFLLKLSQADLEKIDEQYELYKPLLLCEFKIYNNNYINESSIKFLNDSKNDDLTKEKCINNPKVNDFRKLQSFIFDIIQSKQEYKKAYYWQFIEA